MSSLRCVNIQVWDREIQKIQKIQILNCEKFSENIILLGTDYRLDSENSEIIDNFSSYSRSLSSILDESKYLLVVSDKITTFINLVRKVKVNSHKKS